MLTKDKFADGMAMLNVAFPSSKVELTDRTLDVWYRALKDLTNEMYEVAVMCIIRNSRFFPSIAEIRKSAMDLCCKDHTKTGEDAWQEVVEQLRIAGYYGEPEFKDEITKKTVYALDWTCICNADNKEFGFLRTHFIKLYNSTKKRNQEFNELKAISPEYARALNDEKEIKRIK